jgi:hypothetical protein
LVLLAISPMVIVVGVTPTSEAVLPLPVGLTPVGVDVGAGEVLAGALDVKALFGSRVPHAVPTSNVAAAARPTVSRSRRIMLPPPPFALV